MVSGSAPGQHNGADASPPPCRISDTEQSPLLHSPNLIIYTYLAPRGPLCPLFARFPRTGINTRRFLHGSCTVARLPRKDTHIYIYIYIASYGVRVRGVGSHIWAFEAPFSLAFHGRAAPLAAAASLAHRSRSFRRCPGSVSSFRNRLFTRFSRRENGIFSIFRKRKLKTFFINWMDEEIIPSQERIFNNRGVLIIFKYISLRLKEKEGCSLNGFRIIA